MFCHRGSFSAERTAESFASWSIKARVRVIANSIKVCPRYGRARLLPSFLISATLSVVNEELARSVFQTLTIKFLGSRLVQLTLGD